MIGRGIGLVFLLAVVSSCNATVGNRGGADESSPRTSDSGRSAAELFDKRFTSNEIFQCAGEKSQNISFGVTAVATSRYRVGTVPPPVRSAALRFDVFKKRHDGPDERWFVAQGIPTFDEVGKERHAAIVLDNSVRLSFDRFGPLPDADADEEEFDATPFFTLTVDGKKYLCGMEFNPT